MKDTSSVLKEGFIDVRVFETMPGNSLLLSPEAPCFTILAATEGMIQTSGKSNKQLINRPFFEPFPVDTDASNVPGKNSVISSFEYVLQHKQPHSLPVIRYDLQNQEGGFTEYHWQVQNKPVLDAAGNILYIIHTSANVTWEVKAGQREAKINLLEQAHNLLMQAPVAIQIIKGPDLIIELANEPALTLWGTGKEITGKPLAEALPEPEHQELIQQMHKVIQTGVTFEGWETPIVTYKEGSEEVSYFNVVCQPYYEEDPTKATGILVIANDVTEKTLAKKLLEENAFRFKQIANSLPLVVWTALPDGNINFISNQWEELYGNPVAGSLGRGWANYIHPEDIEEASGKWSYSLRTGVPLEMEFRVKHKSSHYHWMLVRAVPIFDEKGEIKVWYGSNTDIEDKKKTEQALKDSKEHLQAAIEANYGILWTNNPEGEMKGEQPGWAALTGQRFEEYQGFGWTKAVHTEDAGPTVNAWNEAVRERRRFVFEHRLKTASGQWRWFAVRGIPLQNPDGTIREWVGVHTDITDAKNAAESIKESEQRVRSLVESAPFPIGVYVGTEMRIELANQSILNTWGKGNDVVGKLYREILPELENQQIFNQIHSVFVSGLAFHAKNQPVQLMNNGQVHTNYFNYSFTPLFDAEGKVYGVMNTAANVTDLAIAKQKVEESEYNLRMLILQSPVAMCIFEGQDYVFKIVNSQMEELLGKKAKDIEGKPFFTAMPEVEGHGLEEILADVVQHGKSFVSGEQAFRLPRSSKMELIYVNYIYEPVKNAFGKVERIMVVAIDVTAQVVARQKIEDVVSQRTQELAEANLRLHQSNIELNQFAYVASHDLQEPLRKIRTFSQLMQAQLGEIPEKAKVYIDKINNAADRMQSLVIDVLKFSQLSKETESFEIVDLNLILKNVLDDYELLIEQKEAAIIIEDKLPAIEAIPIQINQLFTNLVSNALKFSKKDIQPTIKIRSRLLLKEEVTDYKELIENRVYHLVELTDNGIGFNQKNAEQIFTIFQRLHGKMSYQGTGIGLAICKKIVSNHSGIIYATSVHDEGATFTIILPETKSKKYDLGQEKGK